MARRHINEMSPEYIKGKVAKQKEAFKDEDYMRTISAYDYLKKLRQISDFEKYAEEIVRSINVRAAGALEAIPRTERQKVLREVPFEKKIELRENPILKTFPDGSKKVDGDYIVRYISSLDDDVCSIWLHADSVNDAQRSAVRMFWDIKEIIDVFLKPEGGQAHKIDTNKFSSTEQLGNEVAKTLTDGEFQTLPELVADIKDDQATIESAQKPIYEGVDIDGDTWKGDKASVRAVAEEMNYDYRKPASQGDDYTVECVTAINESEDDDIQEIRVTPEIVRKTLARGIVHIVYMKADGTERQAFATTNHDIIADNNALYDGSGHEKRNYNPTQIRYYDLTSKAFRSFVMQRLTMIYDENY